MKKLYKSIKYAAAIFAATIFAGCDDFLTTDPSNQVSSTTALSSAAEIQMVLTSAYKQLLFNTAGGSDRVFAGIPGMEMWYDLRGEDIMSHSNMGGSQCSSYNFSTSSTMASGESGIIWTFGYKLINLCNIIIDALPEASGSNAEKQYIDGQAKAMRAIGYFTLIINYQQTYAIAKDKRGVILRLHADDPNEMGFSTVEQVYAQILSDFNAANTELADFDRDAKWKINTDVVNGYLARVYQVMQNWTESYNYAKKVYDKYNTLMTKDQWYSGFDDMITNNYPEIVWAMNYTDENNLGGSCQVNFWYNQDPETFGEGQKGIYRFFNFFVTPEYVSLFDDSDWRGSKIPYEQAHVSESEEKAVMFWRRTENGSNDVNTKWAYNKWKHYGDDSNNTRPDVSMMRSSEMLLIMAEAQAHSNAAEAKTLLNALQSSRNAVLTATAEQNELLEAIYIERRKELLGEGVTGQYDLLRLQKDLVRYQATESDPANHYSWGVDQMDEYNGSDARPHGILRSNDYRFICQIPDSEFSYNTAISQADQNPFSGQ